MKVRIMKICKVMIMILAAVLLCVNCAALAETPAATWGMVNGMGGTVAYEYDDEGRLTKEIYTEAMSGKVVRTITHKYYESGTPVAAYTEVCGPDGEQDSFTERLYVDGKYLLYESSLSSIAAGVSSEAEYEMNGALSWMHLYGDGGHIHSYWVVRYQDDGRVDVIDYYHMDGYKFMEFDVVYNDEDGSLKYVQEKELGSTHYYLEPCYDENGRLILLTDDKGWMTMNLSYDEAGNISRVFRDAEYEDFTVEWTYDDNGFITTAVVINAFCDHTTFVRGADGLMVQN